MWDTYWCKILHYILDFKEGQRIYLEHPVYLFCSFNLALLGFCCFLIPVFFTPPLVCRPVVLGSFLTLGCVFSSSLSSVSSVSVSWQIVEYKLLKRYSLIQTSSVYGGANGLAPSYISGLFGLLQTIPLWLAFQQQKSPCWEEVF